MTSKEDGAIWPQVKFIKCPIRTSLGVLGKKWTLLKEVDPSYNQRYWLSQDKSFQSPLRIYSRSYAEGPFNTFEGAREGRFYRMLRGKEIANGGAMEAY